MAKAAAHGIEVGAYDLIGWSRNSNGAVPGSMALAPDGESSTCIDRYQLEGVTGRGKLVVFR